MGTLELDSIEASDQGQLHTVAELLLGLLYLVQGHLVRGWGECSTEVAHLLSAADCRGSPGLQAKGHIAVGCSTSMADLDEDQSLLLVDGICNLLPTLSLLQGIEISRSR